MGRRAPVAERDGERLEALRSREPEVCAAFVAAHYRGVFRFFSWLTRDREAAADLTQETFAAFWQSLDGRAEAPPLRQWLYGIARNRWRKRCRDETPGGGPSGLELAVAEALPDAAPGPEARVISALSAAHVRAAVAALPADYREALVLRVFEEWDYSQIGQALGIDDGLARWRVHRARCWLRERLGEGLER
jgi:RNA polymerase sigma-70 factor (ECF subfamily)